MKEEAIPAGFQQGWLPCTCGEVHPIPTEETLRRFERSQTRVPWGKDDNGKDVYTNGLMEDILGLSPWINGWGGDEGYYVDPGHPVHVTAQIVESIDWQRIREMEQFSTPFNYGDKGWMMFGETLLIPVEYWQFLMRMCFKSVPRKDFDQVVAAMWNQRKQRLKTYKITARKGGRKNGKVLSHIVKGVNVKDAKSIAFSKWTYKDKINVGWIDSMTAKVVKEKR